jgi:SAM-dependent methyltransferase
MKENLFRSLLSSLPRSDAVVVEVGMGSFPNAPFFALKEAPDAMDIIGVDPNDSMGGYALANARRAGLLAGRGPPPGLEWVPKGAGGGGSGAMNSVRVVHGVSEALPFEDASVDAVVCSLTLCSVGNPDKSVAEIKRILKPGGKFLWWEHVLSEDDPALAQRQRDLTPSQVRRADGCHLDRRTGETIKAAGFGG